MNTYSFIFAGNNLFEIVFIQLSFNLFIYIVAPDMLFDMNFFFLIEENICKC